MLATRRVFSASPRLVCARAGIAQAFVPRPLAPLTRLGAGCLPQRQLELNNAPLVLPGKRCLLTVSRPALAVKTFKLADIGEGIAQVELLKWHKGVGDHVEEMDELCEVQSDKAAVEITSRFTGTIVKLHQKEGMMVRIGAPLMDIDVEAGEDHAEEEEPETKERPAPVSEPAAASPSVGAEASSTTFSASPATRRFAKEKGVDLARVKGSGRNGLITKEDVLKFLESSQVAAPAAQSPPPAPAQGLQNAVCSEARNSTQSGVQTEDRSSTMSCLTSPGSLGAAGVSADQATVSSDAGTSPDEPLVSSLSGCTQGGTCEEKTPVSFAGSGKQAKKQKGLLSGTSVTSDVSGASAAESKSNVASPGPGVRTPEVTSGAPAGATDASVFPFSHGADVSSIPGGFASTGSFAGSPNAQPRAAPVVPQRPQRETTQVQLMGFSRAMVKSMNETVKVPQLNIGDEYDITELTKMRETLVAHTAKKYNCRPTITAFLIKAVSLALDETPILNSKFNAATGDSYTQFGSHNISVAIDTPNGLVVPNIKNVQDLNVLEIQAELHRLQELATANKLSPADLQGGTISISNVGVISGTYVHALLFDGQACIIGVGQARDLPRFVGKSGQAFDEDLVERRRIMTCAFTADHRHCDGATVARFNKRVKELLENPAMMLLHLR
ncbi:2-oxo acid dehydrogenases acyltransferase (catalytic domain) domain-containing protein [Toxoplasma gondii TgCatPRC2]|uniref:Dihydrolipoamide acetyltransferase component of pyruvate dehydrogenase complex n=5 Tax=Toxoplasma gondii TaxID=5811 RepID=S7UK76_TOXGG|nr:2-oxo acid dehydrogenases acyltransferase (catalytic domain) domain-containing protein [Toxoplasma gondii ME49]EPR58162.1 2-oxo acid dehydrogenases acyltransferase (catalytic domain) domain-containing protein [Toxoplasma gondii GT1]EPT31534.1 2-oxo acid dehydrogenases acyltransferase (catalytic domain) domain-containing protein [Toxoplasma gondii ME49]KYK66818.1 2-oxo acid dehydrogenases acyltransferase (catalytic domain) domain-containing protein [Toxoplasma gondii TgCatPRC2]|eukprot:XP_018638047.1 2-oxo acid dehydrogenases acyltransferase (catalytic domain) domain-containing protein [Toxoplasma gondii ME49]